MQARARTWRGLVLACHPAPTAVVTVGVMVLAAGAGRDAAGVAVSGLAVLIGQLSVGWSNDALDAGRDLRVGRTDKPVVAGLVSPATLGRAAGFALFGSVLLSFVAAGPAGGACHVVFLASAWAYNLGLKATRFSLVPYAVGFGALPGFVTYGLDPSVRPPGWAVLTAALLGVAAGLANAAPDVEDDAATGVRGAVGRLGARSARRWCALVVVAATAVGAAGAAGAVGSTQAAVPVGAAVALVAAVTVAAVAALAWRGGRHLFAAVLGIALVDVTLLATAL